MAYHRVHTEGNCGFLAVHSIMKEKSAQAGEGGGCTPSPFHSAYHQVQSCSVRSSWEADIDTLSPFHLYPICSLCGLQSGTTRGGGIKTTGFSAKSRSTSISWLKCPHLCCTLEKLQITESAHLVVLNLALHCTLNPIYVFPEMKLHGLVPKSYIHVSVSDFYSQIGRPILGIYKSFTDTWM